MEQLREDPRNTICAEDIENMTASQLEQQEKNKLIIYAPKVNSFTQEILNQN